MKKLFVLFLLPFVFMHCKNNNKNYKTDNLEITKISDHTFIHTSFLKTKAYGNVPCNGLIIHNKNQAIVFDTPINDKASSELINWVQNNLGYTIIAIVPTHFHVDCLGGLKAFHKENIPSIASNTTINLAKADSTNIPQTGFNQRKEFYLGKEKVIVQHFGEGHTTDNVVAYFPKEELLFGGCLIKSLNAKKGNLNDANVQQWPITVSNIKNTYPNLSVVVPGHGTFGDISLLDYTIKLFTKTAQ